MLETFHFPAMYRRIMLPLFRGLLQIRYVGIRAGGFDAPRRPREQLRDVFVLVLSPGTAAIKVCPSRKQREWDTFLVTPRSNSWEMCGWDVRVQQS